MSLKMPKLFHFALTLLCFSYTVRSVPGEDSLFTNDPEALWEEMKTLKEEAESYEEKRRFKVPQLPLSFKHQIPALILPESVPILASEVNREVFEPEKGVRPLPDYVERMLLPLPTTPAVTVPHADPKVEVLCHLDRIYVRVLKSVFTNKLADKYLKIGSCPVNENTDKHYYMLYNLKGCGLESENSEDRVTFTNTLHYDPDQSGPIIRELPFDVPIECHYNRYHRSYQVGFYPNVDGGTIHQDLKTPSGVSLTPYDAMWNSLTTGHSFVIGKAMNFKAKAASRTADERLYLYACWVTAKDYPNLKYIVVSNSGCMVDSKSTDKSKFLPSDEKTTLKFSVGAFLFKEMLTLPHTPKTLYMHCQIALGPATPTPESKSCTYEDGVWKELYGPDTVCSCCYDGTCPSRQPSPFKKMITSDSWDMTSERRRPVHRARKTSVRDDYDYDSSWEGTA